VYLIDEDEHSYVNKL